MTLIEWLAEKDITVPEAAKVFGVTIFAVRKWISGERVPRPRTQSRIKRITKGLVSGDDWLPKET